MDKVYAIFTKDFISLYPKMKKILRITLLVLCILTAIMIPKDKSNGASSNTDVSLAIVPGEVDYNVSGSINLGTFSGNVIAVTLTGNFSTGSFWAKDLSGTYYAGTRYWKISSSQMTGTKGSNIPVNTYYVIRPNTSTAVTFSGTVTSGAVITSSSGWLSINGLQQQPLMTLANNSGYLYRVSITPSIAITVPAGQQVDTYRAVLTVTVPWAS